MSKNKNKNQYGSFAVGKAGYRKYTRYFVAALMVVVFIYGGFLAVKKITKEDSKAATAATDGIPVWWYQKYFSVSFCEEENCKPEADPDKDMLSNSQEYFYHTNPMVAYTVGDDLNDGQLVAAGLDPSRSGKLTFDQVSSPESLLGESLVFGKDIQSIVAEDMDISKINLSLVEDDQLQIVYTEDQATYKNYASKLESTFNRYFPQQDIRYVQEILKSGSDYEVNEIKTKSETLALELKTLPVPFKLRMFHKYNIAMFQLLSEIIPAPTDLSGDASDIWFTKVQEFLVVQQKLGFEEQALKQAAAP